MTEFDTYIDSQVRNKVLSRQLIGRHAWHHLVKVRTLGLKEETEDGLKSDRMLLKLER